MSVGPSGKCCDLLGGERGIVGEVAAARVGKPRWLGLGVGTVTNLRGPGAGLGVGDERHGADFAGAMTALAMLLQDRQNVAVESRGMGWLGSRQQG
jgi:hypothetical protein